MKKGLIVLAVLVAACFTRGIDAQNSAPYKNYFELVTMNDPSNLLDKITIYPPVFGILQGGDTRLKIKSATMVIHYSRNRSFMCITRIKR